MTSNVENSGNPEGPILPALAALIPMLVLAVVDYSLTKLNAKEFSHVGAAVASTLTGALIFKFSQKRDHRRPDLHHGEVSGTTVAVSVVLGAVVFWLIDVVAAFFALGVLSAFAANLDSETFFLRQGVISLPLILIGVFLVAVWLAHRLMKSAMRTLNKAVVLYVLIVFLANVLLWSNLQGRSFAAYDVYYPIFFGGAPAWFACWVACRYAGRTQDRFDSTRHAI